jgi:hypothetical protein
MKNMAIHALMASVIIGYVKVVLLHTYPTPNLMKNTPAIKVQASPLCWRPKAVRYQRRQHY